jgi:hypothetical protein
MRTATGVTVTVDSTFASSVNLPPRVLVIGSEGVLEIAGGQQITRYDASGSREEYRSDGAGDLKGPMQRWAEVVRDAVRLGKVEGGAPTFADGLACRQVMDRLRGA